MIGAILGLESCTHAVERSKLEETLIEVGIAPGVAAAW
jgi:hypothetical protein